MDLNVDKDTRGHDRTLKVARTDRIEPAHLLEAIQYRSLDRNVFY